MTVTEASATNERRRQRAERIASITSLTFAVLGIFVLSWASTHAFIDRHFCKQIIDHSRTIVVGSPGRLSMEHPVECVRLGSDLPWISVPASIAVGCIILAFIATIAFVITVLKRDSSEKLGNMTPAWKSAYIETLGSLGTLFAVALLVTVICYYNAVLGMYGLSLADF